MNWLSVRGVLFVAAAAMFAYSARRLVVARGEKLLPLSQLLFWAAFMLISLPTDPTAAETDWPVWAAFALLLASFGLTIAHKTRRRPPHAGAGNEPGAAG